MRRILIVEDDITFSTMLKSWLGKKGFDAISASSVSKAKKVIEDQRPDIILSDLRLPDEDGTQLLIWLNENHYAIPFIIMTSYAEIQTAVLAMKLGASDYISKPVNPDELLKKIDEAFKSSQVDTPNVTPQKSEQPIHNYLEGESEIARQLYSYVSLVAPTNMSVLINGASGTGKEYVAQRIHDLSPRNGQPFIAIDCGAIPKELAASEFFGHLKGSFTGALTDKTGALVAANGGTIFLDEIGNLSYEIQIQLLRALQERKIRPIGSTKEIEVDIRVVSATNENLTKAIENGTFREDLFHRINEFTLKMPALCERKEDIMLFANFFLAQANRELNKQVEGFTAQAVLLLQSYAWPGNLREMRNIIKRATLLTQHSEIGVSELGITTEDRTLSNANTLSLRNEKTEKEQILEALRLSDNNKSKAAKLLNIDRKTLYNKLKLYDLG